MSVWRNTSFWPFWGIFHRFRFLGQSYQFHWNCIRNSSPFFLEMGENTLYVWPSWVFCLCTSNGEKEPYKSPKIKWRCSRSWPGADGDEYVVSRESESTSFGMYTRWWRRIQKIEIEYTFYDGFVYMRCTWVVLWVSYCWSLDRWR